MFTYQNNRRPGYLYDSDGRVTADHGNPNLAVTINYTYDVRGIKTSARKGDNREIATHDFDGDGQRAKTVVTTTDQGVPTTTTTYGVRSSVLGAVVEHVNGQGVKTQQHVYTSGGVELANGSAETTMSFIHVDPVTSTEERSGVDALESSRTELDPAGADVGTYQPMEDDPGNDFPLQHGSPSEPMNLCSVDGLSSDCETMRQHLVGENAKLLFVRGAASGGGGSQRVVYSPSGRPQLIPAWTSTSSADVYQWIPYTGEGQGEGAFGPVPTAYSGTEYFQEIDGGSSSLSLTLLPLRPLPQNSGTKAPLTGDDARRYESERLGALGHLAFSSRCGEFLAKHGVDVRGLIYAVRNQRPFDGRRSTITGADAGVVNPNDPLDVQYNANRALSDRFGSNSGNNAMTAMYPRGTFGYVGSGIYDRSDVYFRSAGITTATIIHEALHTLLAETDTELQTRFGISTSEISGNITEKLRQEDCEE